MSLLKLEIKGSMIKYKFLIVESNENWELWVRISHLLGLFHRLNMLCNLLTLF